MDSIQGRVSGFHSGLQIVLYAKAGMWWVQPYANQPFTKIQPDGTWSSDTHLGMEYAALLVNPSYQPKPVIMALPQVEKDVVAIATTEGIPAKSSAAEPADRIIHFSGYDWKPRRIPSDRNGKIHDYDPHSVQLDKNGFMHLKITNNSGRWICSESILTRSLGYGTYAFTVQDVSHLEPAASLIMNTWSDLAPEQNHREVDIDLSRWGDPESKNAEYVIQPYYVSTNVYRFDVPPGLMTYSFRWAPGSVAFQTSRGARADTSARSISSRTFTTGVPEAGDELIHITFCPFDYAKVPMKNEAEVVIEKFQYLP